MWPFGRKRAVLTWVDYSSTKADIPIVGESFYREALAALYRSLPVEDYGDEGRTRWTDFGVETEPKNRYDPLAVRVFHAEGGAQVGHLSREAAKQLQPPLAAVERGGARVRCGGRIYGPPAVEGAVDYGVVLALDVLRLVPRFVLTTDGVVETWKRPKEKR